MSVKKISEMPEYPGVVEAGHIPAVINGKNYKITPNQLVNIEIVNIGDAEPNPANKSTIQVKSNGDAYFVDSDGTVLKVESAPQNYVQNQTAIQQAASAWINMLKAAKIEIVTGGTPPASGFYLSAAGTLSLYVNSAEIARFTANGIHIVPNNPGISFFLGTFAASDFYLRRNGTAYIMNAPSSMEYHLAGKRYILFTSANGQLWYNPDGNAIVGAFNHSAPALTIGSGTPPASSVGLSLVSTSKFFRPSVMTTAQRNAVSDLAPGVIYYDSSVGKWCGWNGSAWKYFAMES